MDIVALAWGRFKLRLFRETMPEECKLIELPWLSLFMLPELPAPPAQ